MIPTRLPPQPTPAAPARPEARAAQRAFFQAAVDRAAGASAEPVRAVAAAPRVPREGDPAPTRLLRPGSLLNITV